MEDLLTDLSQVVPKLFAENRPMKNHPSAIQPRVLVFYPSGKDHWFFVGIWCFTQRLFEEILEEVEQKGDWEARFSYLGNDKHDQQISTVCFCDNIYVEVVFVRLSSKCTH